MLSIFFTYTFVISFFNRAEKEKGQYFGELNDMRASVDHLANEKVQRSVARLKQIIDYY